MSNARICVFLFEQIKEPVVVAEAGWAVCLASVKFLFFCFFFLFVFLSPLLFFFELFFTIAACFLDEKCCSIALRVENFLLCLLFGITVFASTSIRLATYRQIKHFRGWSAFVASCSFLMSSSAVTFVNH